MGRVYILVARIGQTGPAMRTQHVCSLQNTFVKEICHPLIDERAFGGQREVIEMECNI